MWQRLPKAGPSGQRGLPYKLPSLQITLHFLSSAVSSLPISISVSPSPFPLSRSLPVCLFSLLIKQGQTGFISLVQTEGVSMSLVLEKRHGGQLSRGQVSEYTGTRKHRLRVSAAHGSLPGKPGAFPLATQRPLPPGWNLAGSRENHPTALGSCCLQVSRLARC